MKLVESRMDYLKKTFAKDVGLIAVCMNALITVVSASGAAIKWTTTVSGVTTA